MSNQASENGVRLEWSNRVLLEVHLARFFAAPFFRKVHLAPFFQ